MNAKVNRELAALRSMGVSELRAKYLAVFGEPSRSGNKDFLFKGTLYKLLTNRTYIGVVVYGNQTYKGEHEAIVDAATFEKVEPRGILVHEGFRRRDARGDAVLGGRVRTDPVACRVVAFPPPTRAIRSRRLPCLRLRPARHARAVSGVWEGSGGMTLRQMPTDRLQEWRKAYAELLAILPDPESYVGKLHARKLRQIDRELGKREKRDSQR